MPFDTELAIAAMPQANGQHPEELLRDRYPELAFLFDEVAGLRELIADHDESTDKEDAAYDDGHSTGHDAGYDDGHRIGYDTGYEDGVSAGTE
mgnify:CR=1 FL=1